MRWFKRLRFCSLSVSAKIFYLVRRWRLLLPNKQPYLRIGSRQYSLNQFSPRVIHSARGQKGSFDYNSHTFINIRAGSGSEALFEYISDWYKFYSKSLNFTQVPNKNNIAILVGKDVLKEAKSGKITGFGSNLNIVNSRYDYCYVGALNENNSDEIYFESSILIDPSMGGDTRECLLESFVRLFGFHFSLTLFVKENPFTMKLSPAIR